MHVSLFPSAFETLIELNLSLCVVLCVQCDVHQTLSSLFLRIPILKNWHPKHRGVFSSLYLFKENPSQFDSRKQTDRNSQLDRQTDREVVQTVNQTMKTDIQTDRSTIRARQTDIHVGRQAEINRRLSVIGQQGSCFVWLDD